MTTMKADGAVLRINGQEIKISGPIFVSQNLPEPVEIEPRLMGPVRFCTCCGVEQKPACEFIGIDDEA